MLVSIVLENNTDDPGFCNAVNNLVEQYGVKSYLGDDSCIGEYDYDSEELLGTNGWFMAWRNAAGHIRMTEINQAVSHNNFFSCEV
jgi:hypothetical protein